MYYHISELERRTEGWLCSAYYVAVYYYWDNSIVLVVGIAVHSVYRQYTLFCSACLDSYSSNVTKLLSLYRSYQYKSILYSFLIAAVCTAVAFITHLQYDGNCSFSGDVHSFVV